MEIAIDEHEDIGIKQLLYQEVNEKWKDIKL